MPVLKFIKLLVKRHSPKRIIPNQIKTFLYRKALLAQVFHFDIKINYAFQKLPARYGQLLRLPRWLLQSHRSYPWKVLPFEFPEFARERFDCEDFLRRKNTAGSFRDYPNKEPWSLIRARKCFPMGLCILLNQGRRLQIHRFWFVLR